jgi:UPF0755 protein
MWWTTRLRFALKVSLFAVALVAVFAAAGAWWLDRWLHAPLPHAASVEVVIESGSSLAEITDTLAAHGALTHPRVFGWYVRGRGLAQRLHAGEYGIPVGTTPAALLEKLVRGEVIQHEVKLLEGWTVAQVRATLAAEASLAQDIAADADLAMQLGIEGGNAEGWFFPDTYAFTRGSSALDLLRRAHVRMQRELARAWDERDPGLPYRQPYDVLIMASIIEKETGKEDERGKIARVFVSRLERGMPLQTDPTIIYGLGVDFDGNLTRKHLVSDSNYNTYRRRGLPPTPIALPGRAALDAAVHPAPGDYLYFVARGDGSSEFSTTLAQHAAAVRRYQLGVP